MEPEQQHTYRWMTAVIASALVLVMAMGGVFALRQRLTAEARDESRKQTLEREKLAGRINTLESSLSSLEAMPKAGSEDLTVIEGKLSAMSDRLSALTNRIETLESQAEVKRAEVKKEVEQKPSESPAAEPTLTTTTVDNSALRLKSAALSGNSFGTELAEWSKTHTSAGSEAEALGVFAAGGIPTEAEMIRDLARTLGNGSEAAPASDASTVGKINAHLKGLVNIKKAGNKDVYSDLREEVLSEDLATLVRHVEKLSANDRAPLEDWLKQATDRRKAMDALDNLTQVGGH